MARPTSDRSELVFEQTSSAGAPSKDVSKGDCMRIYNQQEALFDARAPREATLLLRPSSLYALRSIVTRVVLWSTRRASSLLAIFSDFRQRRAMDREYALRISHDKQLVTLRFNGTIQSQMSISSPSTLMLTYTRAMTGFRLFQSDPRKITMIGPGGGSLVKWCYESLPRTHLTVIEINQKVIDLRSHFQIPPDDERLSVVLGDGAGYVQHTVERPDVLLIDGYHLDGLPARETSTQQFYDDCFRTLAEDGILVANLDGARLEWIHRIYRSFAGRVLIVTPKDGHNRIVFGFKGRAYPAESYTIEELTRIFPLEVTGVEVRIRRYHRF
jgi:spermidine synthase